MGYGNAIVRPLAVAFIESVIESFADASAETREAVPARNLARDSRWYEEQLLMPGTEGDGDLGDDQDASAVEVA